MQIEVFYEKLRVVWHRAVGIALFIILETGKKLYAWETERCSQYWKAKIRKMWGVPFCRDFEGTLL